MTNEAAERLRDFLNGRFVPGHPENHADWLDEALATVGAEAYAAGAVAADALLLDNEEAVDRLCRVLQTHPKGWGQLIPDSTEYYTNQARAIIAELRRVEHD